MLPKKIKKTILALTLTLLLSGTTFSNVSAKGDDVAKPISTPTDIQQRISGGPSDSAAWTKRGSWYTNFSHDDISTLNYLYNDVVTGSGYNRGKNLYSAASVLAGIVGGTAISLSISGTTTFSDNYWSLVQNAANTVNQAYYRGGTQALYVTEYYRPATGQTMYSVTWY